MIGQIIACASRSRLTLVFSSIKRAEYSAQRRRECRKWPVITGSLNHPQTAEIADQEGALSYTMPFRSGSARLKGQHKSVLVLAFSTAKRSSSWRKQGSAPRIQANAAPFPVTLLTHACHQPMALPNPAVNRSANGVPPGPGHRYRCTFSVAGAWRHAVVARLPQR